MFNAFYLHFTHVNVSLLLIQRKAILSNQRYGNILLTHPIVTE